MNQEHWEGFWRYVYERQAIWHKRFVLKQDPPWTEDPVLQAYSFTNAYRELDRGTIHCLRHVITSPTRPNLTYPELLCRIVAYRFFNRTEVWDECTGPVLDNPLRDYNGRLAKHTLEPRIRTYADSGRPAFTGAFMVASYSMFPGRDKIDRICYFIEWVFDNCNYAYRELLNCQNPREAHKYIMSWPGVGPFNAYEFLSDMYYVPGMLPWTEDDWANPGPGAKRGIKLIYPERKDYEQCIYDLRDAQYDNLPEWHEIALSLGCEAVTASYLNNAGRQEYRAVSLGPKPLTMRNIEHNLCEYSKYARGRARVKFKPRTTPA